MNKLFIVMLLFLIAVPGWSASNKKKTYVARTRKSIKYKRKRKRVYIRKYPVRSNTPESGEELKLQELVKDFYE